MAYYVSLNYGSCSVGFSSMKVKLVLLDMYPLPLLNKLALYRLNKLCAGGLVELLPFVLHIFVIF